MTKKTTTIHIDEKVLSLAKKNITNFSLFIEDCLRAYLSSDENISNIQHELDNIRDSYLKIHLLSDKQTKKEEKKVLNNDKNNKLWLKIWSDYRNYGTYDLNKLDELSNKTNLDNDFIINMLDDLKMYFDNSEYFKLNSWESAYKSYMEFKDNF